MRNGMAGNNLTFHYPGVSAGYIGIEVEKSALNSRFFHLFFSNGIDLDQPVLFTQRIPKTGFFEELATLEVERFNGLFESKVTGLRTEFQDLINSSTNYQRLINIAKALLRLGETDCLISFDCEHSKFPMDIYLQLQFIRESAMANRMLSKGTEPKLIGLESLLKHAISEKFEGSSLLPVLAGYVALSFRFSKNKQIHASAKFSVEKLEDLLSTPPTTFKDLIAHSIGYRAIAMNYQKGKTFQQTALDKMVNLIDATAPRTKVESIIAQDNKLTAYQTLSKWFRYQKDLEKAEQHVTAMTEIDPFDSVGFSELGIYLSADNRSEEALRAFERAIELGPPAVGMNHFFCGKTLLKLDDIRGALLSFEKSIQTDPLAISPHLELVVIYRELGNNSKVKEWTRRILSNDELSSQLEKKEYDEVVNNSKICVAL